MTARYGYKNKLVIIAGASSGLGACLAESFNGVGARLALVSRRVDRLERLAHSLPMYFILGFGWLDSAIRFLQEFPSVRVIFGYCGFPYFDALWKASRPFENAFVDTASLHIDEAGIEAALKALGADRCLYGSDCPYNFSDREGQFDYGLNLDRLRGLELQPEAIEKVFFRNGRRVLFPGEAVPVG